jgi:hypothetical protein
MDEDMDISCADIRDGYGIAIIWQMWIIRHFYESSKFLN